MRREEILKKAYQLGFDKEKKYGGCSQCTVAALQELFNLEDGDVFKTAHALCGGAGLSGEGSCGALSGGIMVIGLKYGREKSDLLAVEAAPQRQINRSDPKSHIRKIQRRSFELSKKLVDKFIVEYGSVICKDIQQKIMGRSYNLWDGEDYKAFDKAGAHIDKCPAVVGNAARWVAEILLDEAGR